ncbi:hypothetical protein ILYODFUR_025111 [Ilyodon furcidens]|uniref:Uncharacterized protein n=1 Tax=Ilyodon furcidens TaxID=33524 RepID=A0ABV0TLJ6_9TELE
MQHYEYITFCKKKNNLVYLYHILKCCQNKNLDTPTIHSGGAAVWVIMFAFVSKVNGSNSLLEFWPIPPDRTGGTEPGFWSAFLKYSMGPRSGLCDGRSKILTLFSSSHLSH